MPSRQARNVLAQGRPGRHTRAVTEPTHRAAWLARLALVAIVCAAAALRFAGLDWGLRHPVHLDERVYVESVVAMLAAGDFDHRFYTYPGLFFYLLAPGIAWLGPARWWTNDAYYVSRALVAAAGVLDVGLAWFVATRLFGRAAGLAAALFVAVSPLDVRTAHQVRPDVLLEGFGLLALLQFRRLGALVREDARAGALIGLATAIKFSGLFLVPFYVAARLLRSGPRVRGLCIAGALTIGLTLAATPYALLHAERYWSGPGAQLAMYLKDRPQQAPATGRAGVFVENLGYYADAGARALGPLGVLLFGVGALAAVRREPRFWLPALLHPLTTIAVMSVATMVFPRLILPGLGCVYVLAGFGVELLAARSRALAVAVACLAAFVPLRGSLRSVNVAVRPSPADRALDFFEARYGPGTRVLETRIEGVEPGLDAGAMLGFDRTRLDVLEHPEHDAALRLLAAHADVVVTAPGREDYWGASLVTIYEAPAHRPARTWSRLGPLREDGPPVLRFGVPRRRLGCTPVELRAARLSSSFGPTGLDALRDGDPRTSWRSPRDLAGDEWLRIEWPAPLALGRVTLRLDASPARYGPELELRTSVDGELFEPVVAAPSRPTIERQLQARRLGDQRPLAQELVLMPRDVRAVEIRQRGLRPEPWSLAELGAATCGPRE